MFKTVTRFEGREDVAVLGLTPDELEQLRTGTGLWTPGPAHHVGGVLICRAASEDEFERFLARFDLGGGYDNDDVHRVM